MRTLILFKPDCVERKLVGECLARFERRGFKIARLEDFTAAEVNDKLEAHYAEHVDKPYYPALEQMMLAGPLVACVLEGDDVVAQARRIIGPYRDPIPGTIRGDYATSPLFNVVHSSADAEAADREIKLWFYYVGE